MRVCGHLNPAASVWARSVIEVDLDPQGATPLYEQLAAVLRAQIESGELPPNRPLPSVKQLQQTYGVAQGTAEHAVGVLKAEGLVVSVRGKGVYVRP
jgi:DNA-binding GntR family transcriptional regulator